MKSTELSDENERFIHDELAEGTYSSREELMNDALAQLRRYRQLMHRIEEGKQQLQDGRYLEVDEVGLKDFFNELKARGRRKTELRKQSS